MDDRNGMGFMIADVYLILLDLQISIGSALLWARWRLEGCSRAVFLKTAWPAVLQTCAKHHLSSSLL